MAAVGTWPQMTTMHRIGHAIAHRSDGVGCPGTRRHETNTDASARACISGGHESSALLIGGHVERHLLLTGGSTALVVEKHRIVGRQDGAAAVAEYGGYTFISQHLHDHLGAAHALPRPRMSCGAWQNYRVIHEIGRVDAQVEKP